MTSSLLFVITRHKLYNIADIAPQNRTHSRKHISVKSRYLIIAVVVELSALKLGTLAKFIFAHPRLLQNLINFYDNLAVSFHNTNPKLYIDKISLHKLDLKYKMQQVISNFLQGGQRDVGLQTLYTLLFNSITDAVELLENNDTDAAKSILIAAQQKAEDEYIEAED